MNLRTVFLGKKNDVGKIKQFIPKALSPVYLFETTREIDNFPVCATPRLAVILDSFPGGINLSLIQKVKTRLNAGAIICLMNTISREAEIELRSAGLVFLGTPRTFSKFAEQIIESICSDSPMLIPCMSSACARSRGFS